MAMAMRRYKDRTSIMDLPESIIIDIFIFLPLQFIIRCSCVCKQWANLISQPCFIQPYYTSSKSSTPSVQFLIQDRKISNKLFLAQLDEPSCTSPPPDFIVPTKFPLYLKFLYDFYPDPSLVALEICTTCSFTGFVVVGAYDHHNNVNHGKYHIFNPITSQHFLVRQINKYDHKCALVFVQKTNQLKLLSFYLSAYGYLKVDIQTIGTKTWRSLDGSIPFLPRKTQFPTFANGFYHWIGHCKQIISSFDAAKELFHRIPTPANIRNFHYSNLGSLDGFLCICMNSYSRTSTEFWVMNEYGVQESWTLKFVFLHEYRILDPMRCLGTREIVVICRDLRVICYSPSTRTHMSIKFDGNDRITYKAFPYIPSLRRIADIDIDFQRQKMRRKIRYLQL